MAKEERALTGRKATRHGFWFGIFAGAILGVLGSLVGGAFVASKVAAAPFFGRASHGPRCARDRCRGDQPTVH